MKKSKQLSSDISGVAALEFALILPVLLIILLGVVEFGVYFFREQTVQRTASSMLNAIQSDPTSATIQSDAYASGLTVVDYRAVGNYICGKAYATLDDAKAGLCTANDWAVAPTDAPGGVTPYYVANVAYVKQSSFTAMFNQFIPPIKVVSVFKVGGATSTMDTPTNDHMHITVACIWGSYIATATCSSSEKLFSCSGGPGDMQESNEGYNIVPNYDTGSCMAYASSMACDHRVINGAAAPHINSTADGISYEVPLSEFNAAYTANTQFSRVSTVIASCVPK